MVINVTNQIIEELKSLLKNLLPILFACLFGYSVCFWLIFLQWFGLIPIALEVAPIYIILRRREKAYEELVKGPGGGDAKKFLSPKEFQEHIQYLIDLKTKEKR